MDKKFLVDFLNKINIKTWCVKNNESEGNFINIDINKENLAKAILDNFSKGQLEVLFVNTKYKGMSFNGYGPFKDDDFCEWTNQPLAFDIRTAKYDYENCPEECYIHTAIKYETEAYNYMLDLIPFLEFVEDVSGDGNEYWDNYCNYGQVKEVLKKINLEDYFLVLLVYDEKVLNNIK